MAKNFGAAGNLIGPGACRQQGKTVAHGGTVPPMAKKRGARPYRFPVLVTIRGGNRWQRHHRRAAHRHTFPVRLGCDGCSFQFGRTSAPIMPHDQTAAPARHLRIMGL
jgi:hypothetical protein